MGEKQKAEQKAELVSGPAEKFQMDEERSSAESFPHVTLRLRFFCHIYQSFLLFQRAPFIYPYPNAHRPNAPDFFEFDSGIDELIWRIWAGWKKGEEGFHVDP